MAAQVFISYASADEDSARLILEDLESDGVTCWMSARDIVAAEDYAKVIPQAIGDARMLLVVLSSASLSSPHVYREVHLATDDKKPILPVRIDPIKSVEGALKFSLAGCQWVDAVPRLQPALPRIREEVRRLLISSGVAFHGKPRSRFQRALGSAFAWAVVGGIGAVTLGTIRSYWLNVAAWTDLARHWLTLAIVLALPALAIGTQFFLHRRPAAILTLDALFAAKPRAALARTVAALGILGLVGSLILISPPTIQLTRTTAVPSLQNDPPVAQIRDCGAPLPYEVSTSHFTVTIRTGRLNPAGEYRLRLRLHYSDPDSVNFCSIWASPQLQSESRVAPEPQWSDTLAPNRIRFVEIRRPRDAFVGSVRVVFSLVHPRGSPPRQPVEGIATLERIGNSPVESVPIRILASDWRE